METSRPFLQTGTTHDPDYVALYSAGKVIDPLGLPNELAVVHLGKYVPACLPACLLYFFNSFFLSVCASSLFNISLSLNLKPSP